VQSCTLACWGLGFKVKSEARKRTDPHTAHKVMNHSEAMHRLLSAVPMAYCRQTRKTCVNFMRTGDYTGKSGSSSDGLIAYSPTFPVIMDV